ncbi:hypothetical protein GCM10008935_26420 [Alkalibacillus silvisoli]|uniref:Uncharacterized protein n=1 Tax=Alkalibacillus silvisoli TaxID=392823 RepID=A0ABP3K1N6_9BACI
MEIGICSWSSTTVVLDTIFSNKSTVAAGPIPPKIPTGLSMISTTPLNLLFHISCALIIILFNLIHYKCLLNIMQQLSKTIKP